jgi:hypothetical protein
MISRRVFASGLGLGLIVTGGMSLRPAIGSSPTLAAEPWALKLVAAAEAQIGVTLGYDPAYRPIAYPGGDVPRATGVCTDVVVRAYRDGLGIDLQALVHRDMKRAFSSYPRLWGLAATDPNIDHRRVPNLRTFFERQGAALPIGQQVADYRPGDIVSHKLPDGRPHIGIVSARLDDATRHPLMIHNIGRGAREEDILFAFDITGHYRFAG